ncbi:hypothetical protein LguiB_008972 [Lonicera macranthoides]
MGTEIQSKTYFPGYDSMPDLNNNAATGMWALYYEDKTLNSGQLYDSLLTRQTGNGYFGYEKQVVRQTILKHESIFRHQLQELHRLYRRQRELMNEFRSRELHKNLVLPETSKSTLFVSGTDIVQSPFCSINGKNACSPPSQRRTFDLELPADLYIKNEGKQQEERICGALLPSDKDVNLSHGSCLNSNGYLKRTHKLADLNEPILVEETSVNDLGNTTCLKEEMRMQNVYANSNSGFQFFSKEFFQSSPVVRNGVFFPNNRHSESDRNEKEELTCSYKAERTKCLDNDSISGIISEHSPKLFKPLQVEPRKPYEPLTVFLSNQSKTEPQKRRIFGVEISEGNHNLSVDASSAPIFGPLNPQSDTINSEVLKGSGCVDLKSADGQKKHENPVRGLPWLMAKPHCREEQIKKENFYQMSLDSLQNYSPQFFNKVEATKDTPQVLVHISPSPRVNESDQMKVEIDVGHNSKNIFGFPIVDMAHMNEAPKSNADYTAKDLAESEKLEVEDLVMENGGVNNYIPGLMHQVDLNLSLNEEETPPVPSLPKAILKIATTEIDLEGPSVLECEMDVSPQVDSFEKQLKNPSEFIVEESRDPCEEFDRVAAEALIAISSSKPLESSHNDCLIWFADIVSSHESKLGQLIMAVNDVCEHDEEYIPKGMDYFEFMTLKLKQDSNEEQYFYEPQKDGEITAPKRPRRGQARRGRQRKDFQKDILPGLVSLSRHEVREDLETIEDIFRVSGCTWESSLSRRNAAKKGKKHPASRFCTATAPLSLTGWGRRVPRQRCPTSSNRTRGSKCQQ